MNTLLVKTPYESACTKGHWKLRSLCHGGKYNYLRLIDSMRQPMSTSLFMSKSKNKTCAVVGSSGNLIKSGYGKQIDSHEIVIRVNRAPLRKWKKDVGKRTSFRIMSMDEYSHLNSYPLNWLKNHKTMENASRNIGPMLIGCHYPFHGRCNNIRLSQIFGKRYEGETYLLSTDIIKYASVLFKNVRQKSPTIGMISILVALNICKTVDLYGFSLGVCKNNCYHYYDCAYTESHFFNGTISSSGFHDFTAQSTVLNKLSKKGLFKIHNGRCHNNILL